jgi:hypothetical protein
MSHFFPFILVFLFCCPRVGVWFFPSHSPMASFLLQLRLWPMAPCTRISHHFIIHGLWPENYVGTVPHPPVIQAFNLSEVCIMHVRPSYNIDLICWDVKFWSIRMHVFPKGSEEMHAYIAEILRRMFSLWFNVCEYAYIEIPQRFGWLVCA